MLPTALDALELVDPRLNVMSAINAMGSVSAAPGQMAARGDTKQSTLSLSEDERRQVQALSARDAEVRAHEQAHMAAAGGLARGGPSYSTQLGPDGKRYAVGGEVQIDTSPVKGDPRATLQKAEQIQRAAMAPASPSAQDRSVASAAASMAAKARVELLQQKQSAEAQATEKPEATNTPDAAATPEAKICPTCGSAHKFNDAAMAQQAQSAQAYNAAASNSIGIGRGSALQLTA